ncbi:MAG: Na/Pi symporter [Planctomycetota bacterium]|jgi:phosphate:Na+ symporter
MLKRIITPLLFLLFAWFIVSNNDAKTIIAGIAIFLIGMHYMEDGFKLFSGGTLEIVLERFTSTTPRAIGTGFLATAVVQSSSLVSVIIISFLSAELIGLTQAVGVVFGSNIGTTATAWLVSSFGLKIKIAHYALPMLIFGVMMLFSKHNTYKGLGSVFRNHEAGAGPRRICHGGVPRGLRLYSFWSGCYRRHPVQQRHHGYHHYCASDWPN